MILQITYANAPQQLIRAVEHQILARVVFVNVVLMMPAAIRARHVVLDLACVERHQLVLVRHSEPIVMPQTMFANARRQ